MTSHGGHPNFDRVAHVYRWAEYLALGRTLERTREHFLPELALVKNALALGEGDGRFLARLMRQNPHMKAVAVDSSAAMLRLLRERCEERLITIHRDALEITAARETDLIVTHFFLDCFQQQEVETLVQTISADQTPGTLWLVSDFDVPRRRWLQPLASMYIRTLYLAFRVLTGLRVKKLPDPQRALRKAGFALVARQEFLLGVLYTELWLRMEVEIVAHAADGTL